MSGLTLKRVRVDIKFASSDGFSSAMLAMAPNPTALKPPTPADVLAEGIEHLIFVAGAHGAESEALAAIECAMKRVAEWKLHQPMKVTE